MRILAALSLVLVFAAPAAADVGSQWDLLKEGAGASSGPARSSAEGHQAHARGKVIGGRPAGCPHRFCGCAMSLRWFGRIVPDLKLAWNWAKKFPRTSPRPRAVAVRRGHVFELISHVGGSTWNVWDPNSGGGKIRIHQRSVTGYVFVDPGQRYAALP